MTDYADESAAYQQRLNEHALANRPAHLPGPNRCLQCGGHNDNRERGLAICEDCREGE